MPVSVPSLTMSAATPFAVELRHQPVWAAVAGWLLDRTVGVICCREVMPWGVTATIHRLLGAVPDGEVVWSHELSPVDAHAVAVALSGEELTGEELAGATVGWAWQVSWLLEDAEAAGDWSRAAELVDLLAVHGFDREGNPTS